MAAPSEPSGMAPVQRPVQPGPIEAEEPLDPSAAEDPAEAVSSDVERRHARVGSRAHGERLDKWLAALAGEFSRSYLQTLIEGGQVSVDGRVVTACARRVSAGQEVAIDLLPTAQSRAFRAEPMALAVVFEDAHLLVVDKPAGLVVHPAPGHWSGTLLGGLLAHHSAAAVLPRAGIVHRLDKDTTGLMVVAKTLQAMTALVRAIAARTVSREYLALVHGVPRQAAFSIDAPIGRDPVSRVRMAVVAGGKPARTDVALMAAFESASALRCTLHSGRTHQIRVHLASRGHPLLADVLYGGRPVPGLARQALHAERLGFAHPIDGAFMQFTAPLPGDLQALWRRLEAGAAA